LDRDAVLDEAQEAGKGCQRALTVEVEVDGREKKK
jgi:hypothetical protein